MTSIESQVNPSENPKYNEALIEEYRLKMRNILEKMDLDTYDKYALDVYNKAEEINNKFGRDAAIRCPMYHALIGSTIPKELFSEIEVTDFPGEDSIQAFIDTLETKYK